MTVADTFTVAPPGASCTASPAGTVTAPQGATAARRVLSALLVPPATARITVTCTSGGYADRAETVTFAAVAAGRCDDPLGTLANGRTVRSGTIAAGDGCTSLRRHPSPSRTYHARRHTFALHSPAQVTVTMESAASNASRLDTYLLLLDGDADDGSGRRLFYNDDIGPGHGTHRHNSRLTDMSLQPGTYTIEATAYGHYESYGNRATGDYDLTVRVGADPRSGCTHDLGLLGADRYRHDGTITADAACASGHLGSDTSRHYAHWHTFTLDTPAWIDLDALAPTASSIDPHVTLTGTDAGVLAQDDNTGTGNAAQTRGTYLPAGDYLVEIATADPDTAGDYTLTVTVPISGLAQTYEATVDQQTTINFNYWPTNANIDAQSQNLAVASAANSGGFTLIVAPELVQSHDVSVQMSLSSTLNGGRTTTRSPRSAARDTQAADTPRTFAVTVNASCEDGTVLSRINAVLCVTPSQEDLPQHLGQQPDHENRTLYQGPYYVTPGALLGTRDAAQLAIDERGSECGMTVLELTALMLAIGYWENPNNWQDVTRWNPKTQLNEIVDYENQRFPARSLMTLSRKDHEWTPVNPGEDNTRLYSYNSLSAAPSRAFWQPGVGMWQIDKFDSHDLNHGQRADTASGGKRVAKRLLKESCDLSASEFEWWLEGTWGGCKPGDTDAERRAKRSQCLNSKDGLYMANWSDLSREDLYVRIAPENRFHTSRTGGVYSGLRCRLRDGTAIDNVEGGCYFYDTDNPEAFAADHEPKLGHITKAANEDWKTKDSPYAVPFVSFTNEFDDRRLLRFAVFPQSFLDRHSSTPIKTVPAPRTAVRDYSGTAQNPSWQTDTYNGWRIEVHLCRGAVSSFAPDCAWVDVNAAGAEPNRFIDWVARIRAQNR